MMWHLSVAAQASVKYAAPASVFAFLAELHFGGIDIVTVGSIVIGLVAGAVARASVYVQAGADTSRVGRDLLVSGLAILVNFIIAGSVVGMGDLLLLSLVEKGMPEFAAAAVGAVIGFRGNENVPWFARRYMNIDIADLRSGLHDAQKLDKEIPEDMARQIKALDEKDG